MNAVLGSDASFWALSRLAPGLMIKTLLATDPALLDTVGTTERQRAEAVLAQIFPVVRKSLGLRNDAVWAGSPSPIAYDQIAAPTLILSCEDDLFGTAATARLLAARIPGARLTVYPTGGHIWLGHDDDIADAVTSFVRQPSSDVLQ